MQSYCKPNGSISVPLSRGYFALIDEEDYDTISGYKWHVCGYDGPRVYAASLIRINGKQIRTYMHRLIMKPADKSLYVDHINKNTLDNRRANLRIVTPSQNRMNTRAILKSSQYKGVSICRRNGKFQSMITKDGVKRFLGYSNDEAEAARKYDDAAKELFGEFASLNFDD